MLNAVHEVDVRSTFKFRNLACYQHVECQEDGWIDLVFKTSKDIVKWIDPACPLRGEHGEGFKVIMVVLNHVDPFPAELSLHLRRPQAANWQRTVVPVVDALKPSFFGGSATNKLIASTIRCGSSSTETPTSSAPSLAAPGR